MWNRVQIRVRLNTPGQADGIAGLGVNGAYREFSRMVWRTKPDTRITEASCTLISSGREAEREGPSGGRAAVREEAAAHMPSAAIPPTCLPMQAMLVTFFGGSWSTPIDTW